MAQVRGRILALLATSVALAAAACSGEHDPLPPLDEHGWSGTSESGQAPGDGSRADGGTVDGGPGGDAGPDRCAELGGQCMSNPDDPSIPAFCEGMELVEIPGACADPARSCCAPSSTGPCEAAGGQCLSDPTGSSMPVDCAERGLAPIGATCPDVAQTCCG